MNSPDKEFPPVTVQLNVLSPIWKTELLPYITNPIMENLLSCIYQQTFLIPGLKALDQGKVEQHFRMDQKLFKQIIAQKQPWLHYPLALFTPREHKADALKIDAKEFQYIMRTATSIEKIEWFCWIHECHILNGIILYTLLKLAYPQCQIRVVESPVHTWIQTNTGMNLCLYWPSIGLTDLITAMYDKSGQAYKLNYVYRAKHLSEC